MVEVCEGAPVAVSGWVLTDGHDLGPLPTTPSPRPYPTCEDWILKGGPRDRVWTTGPYLSIWLIPLE